MSINISVKGSLSRAVEKLAADLTQPRGAMSVEDLQQLSSDIESQVPISGPEQAATILPEGGLRQQVSGVLQGTPEVTSQARKGALRGALAGAGAGALGTGIAGGLSEAPKGLFMAVPGALAGYQKGLSSGRREELMRVLQEAQEQSTPAEDSSL